MQKQTKTGLIILIVSIIGLVTYFIISEYQLKEKGILVNVEIVDSFIGMRGSNGVYCIFKYKGKEKKLSSASSVGLSKQSRLILKRVPAMYSPKLDVIDVLIRPSDFKEYNIPFPDSMNWVIQEGFDK